MFTKVWMCEFEPDVQNPKKTTNILATCGGDSICFINVETGDVEKKYKQIDEEFYCMCWTILSFCDDDKDDVKHRAMLAAAGVLGDIKLIDPTNLICFQQVSHHKQPVDALCFHPVHANWLLSKDAFNEILRKCRSEFKILSEISKLELTTVNYFWKMLQLNAWQGFEYAPKMSVKHFFEFTTEVSSALLLFKRAFH